MAAASNKAIRASFTHTEARAVKPLPRTIPADQRIGTAFTNQILARTATAAQTVASDPAVKTGTLRAAKQAVIAMSSIKFLGIAAAGT
jgi:hypothetical protein